MGLMEEAFEKLKKDGVNCIDNLIKWIKDSKLIEQTQEAENKTRKLFDDVKDKQHVEYENFKKVVQELAEQQKASIEQLSQKLTETLPKLQAAISAATVAFKEALEKK